MDTHQLTTFNPPPELAAAIIAAFFDPDLTLRDLADMAGVPIPTLSLWIESPEVQAQILRGDNTMTLRTRCIARGFLCQVFHLLAEIVLETKHVISRVPIHPGDTKAREGHRRTQETGRRASIMLMRLASLPYLTAIPPIAKAFEASNKSPRNSSAAHAQPAATEHATTLRTQTASNVTPRAGSQFAPIFGATPSNTTASAPTPHPSPASHTSHPEDADDTANAFAAQLEAAQELAERYFAQLPPEEQTTQPFTYPANTNPLHSQASQQRLNAIREAAQAFRATQPNTPPVNPEPNTSETNTAQSNTQPIQPPPTTTLTVNGKSPNQRSKRTERIKPVEPPDPHTRPLDHLTTQPLSPPNLPQPVS